MACETWRVELNKSGNKMVEYVEANSQSHAREKAERLNPGYRGGSARRA